MFAIHAVPRRMRGLAVLIAVGTSLAACTPGAPRNSIVWTGSLGPFPAAFLQSRPLTDPVFLNTECTTTTNDGTAGRLVRPTLNGRLNDPGSSLSFGINSGVVTCTPPRLWRERSLGVIEMNLLTTGTALVVGQDTGLDGTITLSDGSVFTITAQFPSRLRVTSGNPDDIPAGLFGEFDFVASEAGGQRHVIVRNASFAIYNAR